MIKDLLKEMVYDIINQRLEESLTDKSGIGGFTRAAQAKKKAAGYVPAAIALAKPKTTPQTPAEAHAAGVDKIKAAEEKAKAKAAEEDRRNRKVAAKKEYDKVVNSSVGLSGRDPISWITRIVQGRREKAAKAKYDAI